MIIVGGVLAVSLLLSLQQGRISDLQNSSTLAATTAFKQQLNPGFACGLITGVEAVKFLQQNDILSSGTIIPADSPTAAIRTGSPRLDACSYTQLSNNLSYIDVIVKTYDSQEAAMQAFSKDTASILYIEPGSFTAQSTSSLYSSGVNYLLRGNYILEVGASKAGSAIGIELKVFSDNVTSYIIQKLQ